MAAKGDATRIRIQNVKADLGSTSTCSAVTAAALQELLTKKDEGPAQKENVKGKVQATATVRRRAGTATAIAPPDALKASPAGLTPRDKYVLATEVANTTLKTLADALKSPPSALHPRPSSRAKAASSEDARKPSKGRPGHAKSASVSKRPLTERSVSQMTNVSLKPAPRRSSSYSSIVMSGPDAGLVATAECARIAFAYLGTLEATKVLGKDSQELQLESGVLALIGKLVAHGLDSLAVKEMRSLKKRLDNHLGHDGIQRSLGSEKTKKDQLRAVPQEKESLASLLSFGPVDPRSPTVPLITSLQIYALRVIARTNRPRIVEATWEYLQLSNPSSPANLLSHMAAGPSGEIKAAKQIESLAQTILALCPSVSSSYDEKPLQPSPKTVLLLQQLAFKIRKRWWAMVKHQGDDERELLEPFTKCLTAFTRRSLLSPKEKYSLAEALFIDLSGEVSENVTSESQTVARKVLSSLAQAAGLSNEALRWLGPAKTASQLAPNQTKQTARLIRVATISLDALSKGDARSNLQSNITDAVEALRGNLGGSAVDLDALFMEVNALRRAATRLLVARQPTALDDPTSRSTEQLAVLTIASSVHFSARFIGVKVPEGAGSDAKQRHIERLTTAWKCTKGIFDSVLICCKQFIASDEQWMEVDRMLQECSHIVHRFEEETITSASFDQSDHDVLQALPIKLSNAYWAVHMQLRKAGCDQKSIIIAMQRSISLLQSRSPDTRRVGLLVMKLEQLGDMFESTNVAASSRSAFEQCIRAHIESNHCQLLANLTATESLHKIFGTDGPLSILGRVLKSHHRTFIKFGFTNPAEFAFFDDNEVPHGVRGALLEWQLDLYSRSLVRNRHWNSGLNVSIVTLVERLRAIYWPEKYPIRRLRVQVKCQQMAQSYENILPKDSSSFVLPDLEANEIAGTEDAHLARFETHLVALCRLKISMQQTTPCPLTLRKCFVAWEGLINSSSTWDALLIRVDDIEGWLQDMQACVEYLNAKGEEYLALSVLHHVVKVGELQRSFDSSQLATNLCALALQFLRLGYTGKAGTFLAKTEALVKLQTPSIEANLRWHIAYAEYLARIGNTSKCAAIMSATQSLACSDSDFMDLAKPSTTLSGRLRFNRILADAAYVYSLLATAAGDYKDAARHARQCVTLNRRVWAALESKVNVKKSAPPDEAESDIDGASGASFDGIGSVRNDKGVPLIMSVTHDALNGADFWSLVPTLYRALMQHSQVFAYQGLLHEAVYVAEQAEKVASASKSPTLMTDNASWRADCWAQSGRPDKAEPILEGLKLTAGRKCLSLVGYQSAVARVHHWRGQFEDEIASYASLDKLLRDLSAPVFVSSFGTLSPNIDTLTEQMSQMTVDTVRARPAKATTTARGRKPVAKATQRSQAKAAPKPRTGTVSIKPTKNAKPDVINSGADTPLETPSSVEQCSTLYAFQASIMHRGILANLLRDDLATASALLEQVGSLQGVIDCDVSHVWASFKTMLAQSFKQIAANFTVNTLPESTIAFPSIGLKERRSSEGPAAKRTALASLTTAKSGRGKKQVQQDFVETLRSARDRLAEAHASAASKGPNHMFQQVSMAVSNVTVLLSAISGGELGGSLHPLYAAYMAEIPKCNALRLTRESVESEKEQMSRDECLRWPAPSPSPSALASVSDFQRDYVDIIPKTWTAVSLALNDTRDELYITRFETGQSPFVLRLPLARHASREMDEEEFSFEDGKRDFDEIVELSDFSTRTAKDMTSREARQQWWTEREALDTRLHELLLNMENIWLGGFKGVFSQHERQTGFLARFRKSLENILNQHLPSRRKKTQPKKPILDTRVLELFIGLGDATDEELDLDEALMDLMYFVVDILHFNGERNAYDEIDFDAMVVETLEALRAYHSASQAATQPSRHLILVLDNNLHGFPWESLPCLEKLSISRLPSLAALRERLLAVRASTNHQDAAPGHYIRAEVGGTSILNPSGDLTHTLKTLKPRLDELQGPWTHIASRAPTEKEFEDSLREKDLVLYFGHGSGAQFVRSKSVRRLYCAPKDEQNTKPGCATTFLFGCSSVHLTENGIYEPSGMLSSYLTAGAPAVVGMLWDVTDKDCDRFAVKAGDLWGLWPEPQEEQAIVAPPKTPAKKAKGKSRVARLADEVEGARGLGSAKKGVKKGKNGVSESVVGGDRRRGLGLDECVRDARKACVLRYLNGAAAVVYGIPVYLE